MPMYTFQLRRLDGSPIALDVAELEHDAAAFARTAETLDAHESCDHVEVWDGDRAVVARHRDQPIIRPVQTAP